jgi:hypothetical protein
MHVHKGIYIVRIERIRPKDIALGYLLGHSKAIILDHDAIYAPGRVFERFERKWKWNPPSWKGRFKYLAEHGTPEQRFNVILNHELFHARKRGRGVSAWMKWYTRRRETRWMAYMILAMFGGPIAGLALNDVSEVLSIATILSSVFLSFFFLSCAASLANEEESAVRFSLRKENIASINKELLLNWWSEPGELPRHEWRGFPFHRDGLLAGDGSEHRAGG